MPFSGVSKVTKTGSLPATAPCQAVTLLRILPGLLLTMPRVDDGEVVARRPRVISACPETEGAAGKKRAKAGAKHDARREKYSLDEVTQRRHLGAQFRELFHRDPPEWKRTRRHGRVGFAGERRQQS